MGLSTLYPIDEYCVSHFLRTSRQTWEVGILSGIGMPRYLKDDQFPTKGKPRILDMIYD
jgi:hypothetical protein